MTMKTFVVYAACVAFIALVAYAGISVATVDMTPKPKYPACQYEDGNPDGKPCIWTDPNTGVQMYSDSSEYRN